MPGTLAGMTVVLILTAPTLHPWYLLPVLFVLPLLENKTPLLWLSAGGATSYLTYIWGGALWPALALGWGGAAISAARGRLPVAMGPLPGARRQPSGPPPPATAPGGTDDTT